MLAGLSVVEMSLVFGIALRCRPVAHFESIQMKQRGPYNGGSTIINTRQPVPVRTGPAVRRVGAVEIWSEDANRVSHEVQVVTASEKRAARMKAASEIRKWKLQEKEQKEAERARKNAKKQSSAKTRAEAQENDPNLEKKRAAIVERQNRRMKDVVVEVKRSPKRSSPK